MMRVGKRFLVTGILAFLATTSARAGNAGGVIGGGGGGGTLPGQAVTAEDVNHSLAQSKRVAISWLYQLESKYKTGCGNISSEEDRAIPRQVLTKLFGGSRDVFKIVESLKIESRSSSACIDGDGTQKDGSIYSTTPGAICISAQRLTAKLNSANLDSQVEGLVLHEMTHLVGGDEAEAVAIQKAAVADLQTMGMNVYMTALAAEFTARMDIARSALAAVNQSGGTAFAQSIYNVQRRYLEFGNTDGINPSLSRFRAQTSDLNFAFYYKIQALYDFACMVDSTKSSIERIGCRKDYDRGFNGALMIDAFQFAKNYFPDVPAESQCRHLVSLPIKKVKNHADLKSELSAVGKFFYDSAQKIGTGIGNRDYQFDLLMN